MLESLSQNLTFLMEEGVVVMLTGMGVVFSFLAILVVAMFIMGTIITKINKLFPAKAIEAIPARKSSAAVIGEDIAVAIAAVISRR